MIDFKELARGRIYEAEHHDDIMLLLYAGRHRFLLIGCQPSPRPTMFLEVWRDGLTFLKTARITFKKEVPKDNLLLYIHYADKRPLFRKILAGKAPRDLSRAWKRGTQTANTTLTG